MAKREASSLYKALESFGRRSKRLSPARLEYYPEVLIALFGQDAVASTADRHSAAERTDHALREIVAAIQDPTDRRIADALLAVSPEFWDMNVTERQEYVENEEQPLFSRELYKTQRARVLGDVVSALPGAVGLHEEATTRPVLSPEARNAAEHLYRYLQDAILRIDAYDFCAHASQQLDADNRFSSGVWLVSTRRDHLFDEALWLYVYARSYFNECLRHPTSRSFLRERLADEWWRGVRFNIPYTRPEAEALFQALAAASFDDPSSFGDELCKSEMGSVLYERWMRLLGSAKSDEWSAGSKFLNPTGTDRRSLARAMKHLAGVLQSEFTEATWSTQRAEEQFGHLAGVISMFALMEVGVPDDDEDGIALYCLTDQVLEGHWHPYESDERNEDLDLVNWRWARPWWY